MSTGFEQLPIITNPFYRLPEGSCTKILKETYYLVHIAGTSIIKVLIKDSTHVMSSMFPKVSVTPWTKTDS